MSLIAVGVTHSSAPIDLLERVTIQPDQLTKALVDLSGRPHLSEVVVLSTCNRTEVFAIAEKFHGAYADIRDFFVDHCGLSAQDCTDHVQTIHDDAAVSHLFAVASGLDSVVLGESEILGQVKRAWMHAQETQCAGPTLNLLFRHAINTGKRARSETAIGRSITSMSYAAVALATGARGDLSGYDTLVIGAGEMATGVVRALRDSGARRIQVSNRTAQKATALSELYEATVVPFDELGRAAANSDIVISATSSPDVVLRRADLETHRPASIKPLTVIDIAMPRDVDASVATLHGVRLMGMSDIQNLIDSSLRNRHHEVAQVHEIISINVELYLTELAQRSAAPLVADLHKFAEETRLFELAKSSHRFDELSPAQRNHVDAVTKAIVAKLIHGPTTQLKSTAGTPRGDRLAQALRELFDL